MPDLSIIITKKQHHFILFWLYWPTIRIQLLNIVQMDGTYYKAPMCTAIAMSSYIMKYNKYYLHSYI